METISPIAKRLMRFYSNAQEAQQEVERLLADNPTFTDAQVFNFLAFRLGKGCSHMSAFYEGEIKPHHPIGRAGRRRY